MICIGALSGRYTTMYFEYLVSVQKRRGRVVRSGRMWPRIGTPGKELASVVNCLFHAVGGFFAGFRDIGQMAKISALAIGVST
jgi:hypothetical protein